MRRICLSILLLLAPLIAGAAPADSIAKAKDEIAAHKIYAADALLQEVVNSKDAAQAQVEEALVLQTMIYCGDVIGAGLTMPPLAGSTSEGSKLKAMVGQQLLMARRAFHVAAGNYLNTTMGGHKLEKLQLELPPLSEKDVEMINAALADKATLKKIIGEYDANPAAGQGLVAQANHLGLYTAFAAQLPRKEGRTLSDVRAQYKAGAAFGELRYLDWLARTAKEFNGAISEPKGPDLLGLSKRCDERLLKIGAKTPDNQYVKNAKARRGK